MKKLVLVVQGSSSDTERMRGCLDTLAELEIPYEHRILSAHRTPVQADELFASAADRGLQVVIAAAGVAAHLAGAAAARTDLPVIGVPLDGGSLQGLDALLSTVQMPPGVPVASMAIGRHGATNAALFAVRILALQDGGIRERLVSYRRAARQRVLDADAEVRGGDEEEA